MNLAKRLFGGGIILFVLILITYLGGIYFALGFGIFSLIAVKELVNALKNLSYDVPLNLALFIDLFFVVNAYIKDLNLFIFGLIFILIGMFIYMIFNKKYRIEDFFGLLFVIVYVSIFMSSTIWIGNKTYLYMLYIIAWGSDTFAYLSGSLFGKHKIKSLESISPNKTLEGFIGGVFGAVLLNLLYVNFIKLDKNIIFVIIFTIIASLLSETGDLLASFIKRKCKIKDYGNLIPGHGGILDRFDSILFISPFIYLFTLI